MSELSCRCPQSAFAGVWRRRALLWAAIPLALLSGQIAQAQITTQMLIGDAVSSDAISRYTDVDEAIK